MKIIKYICNCTSRGLEYISLMLLKGIYFYLYLIVVFFRKIFKKSKLIDNMYEFVQLKPRSAESSLLVVFMFIVLFSIFDLLFFNTNEVVKFDGNPITIEDLKVKDEVIEEDDHQERQENIAPEVEESKNYDKSLFKYYGNMQTNQIDFSTLKNTNNDTVGWLIVDGTNINYPIVQTVDNDFYLSNNFNKVNDKTGWPFIDYRNNLGMTDDNTIFYGHNLLNNTSFGSISKIFGKSWFNKSSHKIIYLTNSALYTYEIFSAYYIRPENYYLQTNISDEYYLEFINTIKERSIIEFNVEVGINDKIITLSTCTDDNTGRKVIHAKLISEESY